MNLLSCKYNSFSIIHGCVSMIFHSKTIIIIIIIVYVDYNLRIIIISMTLMNLSYNLVAQSNVIGVYTLDKKHDFNICIITY